MAKKEPRAHYVLITGATDGIGFELAQAYAAQGHFVLATGRRSIVNDVDFFGNPNIKYIRADQEEPRNAARNISEAMRQSGWTKLDLAVLNAGVGLAIDPAGETAAQIKQQITVNLTSPVFITLALAPWLFVDQGKLVLIGSTASKGQPKFATYAATKAGLDSFSRSLREEWRGRAEVQMIHPGPTRTSMHEKAGLKIGMAGSLFMSTKRAALAIQRSIRKGDRRRELTRTFGWGSVFSRGQEGQL